MDNMDKYVGKLLDNRYEILEIIGVGGMAAVYKARCHRLNRLVAVKILRDEFAVDEDFRRRFYTESQAVAMLSHPNIVAVYDVSKSSDVEYIVMELIEGITLKQYMQRRGRMSWKEALHFATQITKALSHAHSRGIIHRDIKPHNIMILRDGSVKVTDFGIARLQTTQNTLTQEALGSVHYMSPEQAKGGQVDARTDIYSVGIVMYEMLTGRLPFEGDSPVSIAIQHISSIPLMPREINEDIPEGLEKITMRAMEPDLNRRYQSADDLLADLEEFRKNPDAEFVFVSDEDIAMKKKRAQEEEEFFKYSNMKKEQEQKEKELAEIDDDDDDDDYEERRRYVMRARRTRKIATLTGIACMLAVIVGILLFLWNFWVSDLFDGSETIKVPKLIGSRIEDVLLNPSYTDYFDIIPSYEYNSEYEKGVIFEQDIPADKNVIMSEKKTTINVVISSGKNVVPMPQVIGIEHRQASITLSQYDLKVELVWETSDTVTSGYVISCIPDEGTEIAPGTTVYLTVSSAPEIKYEEVPNLIGLTKDSAISRLESYNLTYGEIKEEYSDAPKGEVIWQSFEDGAEVPQHTKINFTVSKGPEPTPSPSPSPSDNPGSTNDLDPDVSTSPTHTTSGGRPIIIG